MDKHCLGCRGGSVTHTCKDREAVSNSSLSDGLDRMPIEAVDVESEWQVAQDHIEDGNTEEALRWLSMTIKKINILRTKLIKDSFAV